MADELVLATPEIVQSVHLVARNPQQMAAAQSELTAWLKAKRDSILGDIAELETARDEAKRHKWKTSAFNSAIGKFRKQHDYYQKILEVVLAGYTLIPNFPIDVFAVGVTRDRSLTEDQYGGVSHKADYLASNLKSSPSAKAITNLPNPTASTWYGKRKTGRSSLASTISFRPLCATVSSLSRYSPGDHVSHGGGDGPEGIRSDRYLPSDGWI